MAHPIDDELLGVKSFDAGMSNPRLLPSDPNYKGPSPDEGRAKYDLASEAAMFGTTFAAVKNPLRALETIGVASSNEEERVRDVQFETASQKLGTMVNPLNRIKNLYQGTKKTINTIGDLMNPQLVPAGGGPNMRIGQVDNFNPAQPLQAASDPRLSATTPRNWGKLSEAAVSGDRIQTASLLRESSPNFQKLSKRNQYIKVEELAADPDLVLDLAGRNKEIGTTFQEYIHALGTGDGKRASTIGRSLNDIASKNPLDPSTIIYGNKTIRDRLKNKFVEFTGQEWHHVFGSKEIGETMLTKISGEPMMAANIFKFLDEVGVPTSGTAKNMALMSKAKHTGKGTSYHDWAKSTGFEPWTNPASSLEDLSKNQRLSQQLTGEKRLRYPEGKFTAPLDFPDLMKSVSESILKGEAEVDEFMDMLRTYAKSVRPHIMKKLKDYDARIVSDIEGVERVILDEPYKATLGTRRGSK